MAIIVTESHSGLDEPQQSASSDIGRDLESIDFGAMQGTLGIDPVFHILFSNYV